MVLALQKVLVILSLTAVQVMLTSSEKSYFLISKHLKHCSSTRKVCSSGESHRNANKGTNISSVGMDMYEAQKTPH